MSKEIKFAVTPEERDRLDIEAAAHGVSRAQLVRDRALNAGIIPRVQMLSLIHISEPTRRS